MKKKKNKMKKRISLLIATILAVGIAVPPLVNYVTDVKATDIAPSVEYYAEPNDLRTLAGTPGTVKIRFGRISGTPVDWYILDTQSDNNIELLSAQSFGEAAYQSTPQITSADGVSGLVPFNTLTNSDVDYDLDSNKSDIPDAEDTEIEYVYANHYGASTLRDTLTGSYMSQDFNATERSLMIARLIPLVDKYNTVEMQDGSKNNKSYYIRDQLYLPEKDVLDGRIAAEVGPLWTMTEIDGGTEVYTYKTELQSDGSTLIGSSENTLVSDTKGIWPAFTLDLAQDKESGPEVLFASVVPTGPEQSGRLGSAGVIDPSDQAFVNVMNLRLDGSKGIYAGAELAYNGSTITYKKIPSGSKIVIQGKYAESNEDWYYCAEIDGDDTILSGNISGTIKAKLTNAGSGNIDFKSCKIWVETISGEAIYALKGHEGIVKNIEFSLSAPTPGERLAQYAQSSTWGIVNMDSNPNGFNVVWSCENEVLGSSDTAEFGKKYRASITVQLDTGYSYASDLTASVPGATLVSINTDSNANVRTLVFEFETEQDTEIKYDVYYDNELIDNPVGGITRDYDGETHPLEIIVTEPRGASIEYSADGGATWRSWVPVEIGDAGEYIIDYRLTAGSYETVNTAADPNDEWEPIVITIQPREIRVTPGPQDILWGYEIEQGPDHYKVVNAKDPDEDALLTDHKIKGLTLTASQGAKVNTDGIICYGYIYFNSEGEDGESLITIVDTAHNNRDVTKNYVVIGGSPGELIVRHNENLPPESITVEKAKTTYTLGEALLVNDLKITARYGDGYTELVPRGGGHDSVTTNEEDIDMTTLGGKTLTVTYTREEPEEARGSASSTLTLNVVEEDIPIVDPSPGDDDDNNNNDNNNNDNNNNSGNDGNSGNNNGSSNNGSQNNGSTTNPGTTTRSATDPTTTSTTGTTGSTTNTTGTSSKTATASGARTGDTNPIAIWVLTALCSGIVVVSLMIFNINRGSRKRKSKR